MDKELMKSIREILREELEPIKSDIKELKEGQKEIKEMFVELDPKNDNRYLELKDSIDQLRKDLSTFEIVIASNYSDIARLKSRK